MSEAADPTRWQREWSPRKARICPKCHARHFGDLAWVCPEHRVAEDQKDRPYMGSFPKARVPGLEIEGRGAAFVGVAKPPDGVTYGAGKGPKGADSR